MPSHTVQADLMVASSHFTTLWTSPCALTLCCYDVVSKLCSMPCRCTLSTHSCLTSKAGSWATNTIVEWLPANEMHRRLLEINSLCTARENAYTWEYAVGLGGRAGAHTGVCGIGRQLNGRGLFKSRHPRFIYQGLRIAC